MTYKELLENALRVREKYNALNARDNGGAWDGNKLMAGFVGDVGAELTLQPLRCK